MVKWQSLAGLVVLGVCALAAPAAAQSVRLEQVWRVGDLAAPESVALSADGTFLYVTNVSGEGDGKDGDGFISRVSLDGRMLQRDFATGLDAPKGIVLRGDELIVADIDQIVFLDAATGAVRNRVPVSGARFLNDVALTPGGMVLVADSGAARINSFRIGDAWVWLADPLLQSVNGLLPERDRLIVTTMAGRLLAIDWSTKAITVLAEGLGNADGVAALGDGRYLVSEWPGLMHVVNADGTHETISDTRTEQRFMNDFLLVGDVLYQPHWMPGELTAYRMVQGAP